MSASLPGASAVSLNFAIFPCFHLTASDFRQISHFGPIVRNHEHNLELWRWGSFSLSVGNDYT